MHSQEIKKYPYNVSVQDINDHGKNSNVNVVEELSLPTEGSSWAISPGKKRRREQWSRSHKRRRGDRGNETADERDKRLEYQKIRNDRARNSRTMEEWQRFREQHQTYKANRLTNENCNQRFWRLLSRREYRRKGYYNTAIRIKCDDSIGKYGEPLPMLESRKSGTGQQLSEEFTLFYKLLGCAEKGILIPDSRFTLFAERGIDLPTHFFDSFLLAQTM